MKDNTGFFIVLMIVLMIGVFFGTDFPLTGEQNSNKSKQTTEKTEPLTKTEIEQKIKETKERVTELEEEIRETKEKETRSPYFEMVTIAGVYTPSNRNIDNEYLTLRSSYDIDTPIDITGWTIKSRLTGNTITIPKGSNLYLPNNNSYISNIEVSKSQYIYINTGTSPIGESFRANICSGYHNQFYDFKPYITEYCPYPIDDVEGIPYSLDNEKCFDFIDDMNRCEVQIESIPNFSSQCTEYINQKVNYPTCVSKHKNDDDFYKNEWRIFLRSSQPLWRISKDTLDMFDKNGKVVDTYSYGY